MKLIPIEKANKDIDAQWKAQLEEVLAAIGCNENEKAIQLTESFMNGLPEDSLLKGFVYSFLGAIKGDWKRIADDDPNLAQRCAELWLARVPCMSEGEYKNYGHPIPGHNPTPTIAWRVRELQGQIKTAEPSERQKALDELHKVRSDSGIDGIEVEPAPPEESLGVFKGLTANELTVRLLRKDENSQPDRVELSAGNKKRTVFCTDFGLIDRRTGLLNREGEMLLALSHGQLPQSSKANEQPKTKQALAQAMKELRKIFRGIGIMDKDPFHPKNMDWEPRFKLIDAIEKADKRAADRAIHIPLNDNLQYDREVDPAGRWLQENDK